MDHSGSAAKIFLPPDQNDRIRKAYGLDAV
jgi:hypothetical protein